MKQRRFGRRVARQRGRRSSTTTRAASASAAMSAAARSLPARSAAPRFGGPDMGQMGLARPLRPDQQQLARRGQSAPAVQRRQRQRVRRGDEEIRRASAPRRAGRSKASWRITARRPRVPAGSRASQRRGKAGCRLIAAADAAKRVSTPMHRRHRHRDQHADEAEHRPEGRQREQQPDRMQAHRLADQLRRQDVALDELARRRRSPATMPIDTQSPQNWNSARPIASAPPTSDADIGNEGDRPGNRPDDQPELQPRQPSAPRHRTCPGSGRPTPARARSPPAPRRSRAASRRTVGAWSSGSIASIRATISSQSSSR